MCELCGVRRFSRRMFVGAGVGAPVLLLGGSRRIAAAESVAVAPDLLIARREAWAGDGFKPLGPLVPEDVRFLIVHHTASGSVYSADEVPAIIQGVYRSQTSEKGWPDTCYNFLIDRYGGVWEGRSGSLAGPVMADATGGSQGFAQLVCLIGDFTSEMPTDAQLLSLQRTLAWLAVRHQVSTDPAARVSFVSRGSNRWPAGTEVTSPTIVGHRDMSQTACPGDTFYPLVNDGLPAAVHRYVTAPSAAGIPAILPAVS